MNEQGQGIQLGNSGLAIAFPCYLAIDQAGRIVMAGPVITRLLPELAELPKFSAVFSGGRTDLSGFNQLESALGRLIQFSALNIPELILRGQFLRASNDQVILFIGSPAVTRMSTLLDLDLSISDFALQDPVCDYLMVLQTQASSLTDATNLADAFVALNHQLEERVEQRTASLATKGNELATLNATLIDEIEDRHRVEGELRLAQKLESVGQLAAGIAHEINTPIQFIGDNLRFIADTVGQLEEVFIAQENLLTVSTGLAADDLKKAIERADLGYARGEVPKAAAQALEGVERVASLVRALKEFSHPGGVDLKPVDLNQAIRTTAVVARNEYKYVADLHFELDESLPLVTCNLGEINQVILNLIVNAAHAVGDCKDTRGMGAITVSTMRHAAGVEIRIRDSGTGIPEAVRDRIFDPFFTTKEVGKGTGQGLYLAHSIIVGRHQGTIRFETEIGVGTTFIIQLPGTVPR